MSFHPEAVIDLSALTHNADVARRAAPNSKLMAVIKADAYGHGMLAVAQALSSVDGFAVARLEEAIKLRQAGIDKIILVLTGFSSQADLEQFCAYDLDAVIHSEYQVELLHSADVSTPISAWLKINTGMNRLGVDASAVPRLYDALQLSGKLRLPVKLMTHLACADDMNSSSTTSQISVFDEATLGLNGEQSIANSAGLLGWKHAQRHWVRPGIMLYGASPFCDSTASDDHLLPVMTLKSRVLSIRTVRKSGCVGYGSTWQANRTSLIAIVAIGYGDGYPRHAVTGTPVLVAGQVAPLVGCVSMDSITVDISQCNNVRVGDEVVLWGRGLPIEEVAEKSGTISYELLCGVTHRVSRSIRETLNVE
ncbi:alanine racemase [Cycloclasticus sp.]|jgi:alanine racemase|uniref:alanine racemase n=1 Tax=Cycloclasticus TaxID=34067 RepID=UPI000C10FA28|nr:alanine racemase [Cycloclasticus sp.]PHR51973.1 MAG: alanine racemase [Cycloclasticus sp.]